MIIEFQRTHDQADLLVTDKCSGFVELFSSEKHEKIIDAVLSVLRVDYPKAYEALCTIYKNAKNYKFLMARRFIRCNMSVGDNITDFDGNSFNFEDVVCPMRGECRWDGIVCRPEFNSELSACELSVARLAAKGMTDIEIANTLHKSIFTVQTQIKKSYKKIGVSSRVELILYINKNFPDNSAEI